MTRQNARARRSRPALLTVLFGLAGLLTLGSAKRPGGPQSQQQPPPGQPPPGGPAPGVGVGPPAGPAGAPKVARIRGNLPDGIAHGYYWMIKGAGKCPTKIPKEPFRRCSVDRGQFIGCGGTVGRNKDLPLCVRGSHRACLTDGDGKITSCAKPHSGWALVHRRGLFRECCIHGGRLVTCTTDDKYICTQKDRQRQEAKRRQAERRRREAARRRAAAASRGSYERCRVISGSLHSGFCERMYTGYAVVYTGGSYKKCRINAGSIGSCEGSYTGSAVVRKGGSYKKCKLSMGSVTFCEGGFYTGYVVVRR